MADDEAAVRQVVDDLFVFTDRKEWARVRALFADGPIAVDMSSLAGGGPVSMTGAELVAGFETGLHEAKQSHHQTSNYRIDVSGDAADVWAHGYAWNKLDGHDELWETWGNYALKLRRASSVWRITAFTYLSKATRGDDRIRTHTMAL